ncbi:hypothetical protein [Hymenobacter fodinae]|uniref:Uncharacterized protein n=1 Tax=Hymenobacter fodinae TaxID=2510796 RepID=A0A4Z0P417_9BACT|nr:hypothetical protein [Hymenobacter fodinae]TGE06302.1 hypothetical protein EU556_15740 [Hymenobacter fodinae]
METKLQVLSALRSFNPTFTGRSIVVDFESKEALSDNTKNISQAGISYDDLTDTKIEIDLAELNLGYPVFYNAAHFLKEFNRTPLQRDFSILFYNDDTLLYKDGVEFVPSKSSSFFIANTVAAAELKKALVSICDYNNDIAHELVYHTSTKGVFKLPYSVVLPQLNDEIDYSKPINTTINKLSDINYQLFFKNQLADFIKRTDNNYFTNLLLNIEAISSSTDKDLDLYIKNFSWESFRSKLYSEKDKYFASLREILGKIMTQLIAVPISISATIFATYKVKDPYILLLVGIAFTAYVIFVIHIQCMYYKDVAEIKHDFERDFNTISSKSGLEPSVINFEKDKIERRIKNVTNLIIIFSITITILGCLFNFFLAQQYFSSIAIKIILGLLLLIYSLVRGYYALHH